MTTRTQALLTLMPLGGWTDDGENVTILPDGEAHGYTKPTKTAINAAIKDAEHNEPILEQLYVLDDYVPRAVEDLIIAANTDEWLVGKANEKKLLRSQLK